MRYLEVLLIYKMYTKKINSKIWKKVWRECRNSTINATKRLSADNNEITFTSTENTRFIHMKINDGSKEPIGYSIINPSGEMVKSGEIINSDEFNGKGKKGEWKVVFDINDEKSVDYRVWTGNIEDLDK